MMVFPAKIFPITVLFALALLFIFRVFATTKPFWRLLLPIETEEVIEFAPAPIKILPVTVPSPKPELPILIGVVLEAKLPI